MTDALVSIIVPTLNQAHFIGATLDSILKQDHPNIECIVIDGGSTDGTIKLLKSYSDSRLTWMSEPDHGQSDAINKGLRRATGEIFSYLNSDDLLHPGAIRFIVGYLRDHADTGLIYGDCDFINEVGAAVTLMKGKPFVLERALLGNYAITQPGTFWRRAVYEDVGEFDVSMHYVMDIDYWLRAAIAGCTFAYVPQTLSAFRLHRESKSISSQPKFLSEWRRMMEQFYARPNLPAGLSALKAQSERFVEWAWAKTYWMQGDYASARPLLRQYLRGNKRGRQVMAATMLVDSILHTPFTRLLAFVFRRVTGNEILFERGRVI